MTYRKKDRNLVESLLLSAVITIVLITTGLMVAGEHLAAQPDHGPPAVARFCGQGVVPVEDAPKLISYLHKKGCYKVEVVDVSPGWVFVYGVQVYVGE